ncbi:MAG: hypothetical protein D6806_06585 [Deltaproteobacteria bacterium]|nr:MAG: hypothetical protein D6806_06585 [Deltaproteobacteria bacterium]
MYSWLVIAIVMEEGMARIFFIINLAMLFAQGNPAGASDFPWKKIIGPKVERYRSDFLRKVEQRLDELKCYGSCSLSISECVRKGMGSTAPMLAKEILNVMESGIEGKQLEKWLESRRKSAHPEFTSSFALDGLTPFGPAGAPVVVVEFLDFECPFCSRIAPVIHDVIKAAGGKAKLYWKMFPLKSHPHSVLAARACVAASRLGKSWDYCPKIYELKDVTREALVALAIESGIDEEGFIRELDGDASLERVADDKMEGLRALVNATPAFFINGKKLLVPPDRQILLDRIEEEIFIKQGRD